MPVGRRTLLLTLLLALALLPMPSHAQLNPDGTRNGTATPAATATPIGPADNSTPVASPAATNDLLANVTVAGCDAVGPYERLLWRNIGTSGAFADYFSSTDDPTDLTDEVASQVVTDGETLLGELRTMEVPEAYLPGHEGIMRLIQSLLDEVNFYHVDSSVVPNLDARGEAIDMINGAETTVADACPDQVSQLQDGYIFLPPTEP